MHQFGRLGQSEKLLRFEKPYRRRKQPVITFLLLANILRFNRLLL